jgi:peptidoglycan/xylan/chitin deacetylase (PgdA/CDA1 family)
VNQRIGGGTWIYLGTFPFICPEDGKSPTASIAVSLKGKPGEVISVDAIKLGGGMGNIARRPSGRVMQNVRSVNDAQEKAAETAILPESFTWKTSGKSRYREGARYYLQYAGFPDTLVYNLNKDKNDYNDDYQSRGEWVNYLIGNPNGPQKNRKVQGLQIPVDLAFAFHTDAGITPDDSIIGTLAIYSTLSDKGKFPDGTSRMASRDLSDLIQSQITDDIRALFNPDWTRRGLWDKQYSEAWRPNVPVMLLELLSHQNLADMRFGLDPRFQFAVGRAIYKGMLRFQAFQEGRPYTVHPLPVDHFALHLMGDTAVKLTWRPVSDPLEPTAIPEKFRIYSQTGRNGFDEGMVVADTTWIIKLKEKGKDYSFKVTALNSGGESFSSETLSAGLAEHAKGTVLVVNGFDRICGPLFIETGSLAGLEEWKDQGIPWYYNQGYTGRQYDFNRQTAWKDDDNPGWGSSYGDEENLRIPGNTFNYTIIHGKAFREAGFNYVAVSDEVFEQPGFDVSGFSSVDIIMGEEKNTPALSKTAQSEFQIYTPAFRDKIKEITKTGKNILISGAYIGSDFTENSDTISEKFAKETLHFIHRTGHAVKTGPFYSTDYGNKWFNISGNFRTGNDPGNYSVESPDGIEPAGEGAFTAFRYGENNVSAGIAYHGKNKCVVLGFPLETITDQSVLNEFIKQVTAFFEEQNEFSHCLLDPYGAIIRTDTTRKVVSFISSADEFGEGAQKMLDVLSEKKVKASFFLTGNFLRNPKFREAIAKMKSEGHYIGPHSDRHLLYNTWEKRDSLLVTGIQFRQDVKDNLKELSDAGIKSRDVRFFLPPYEWYNRQISLWSREMELQVINFTPGTGTNADYTTPDMPNYKSSDELLTRLLSFEKNNRLGLNGALVLIHLGTHPDRKDKFYDKLGYLIDELRSRGYEFGRF